MGPRVIVRFHAGPTWTTGGVREQPGWDAHAAYVDALVERGTIVLGGPYADESGSMSVWEGVDEAEAARLVAQDPFIHNGVFVVDRILGWDVFVDELSGR
jgi:uncharacterized protein